MKWQYTDFIRWIATYPLFQQSRPEGFIMIQRFCCYTCEEGLDPVWPLLDLLSLPSLFFLPLDTLADSLSPRGALSAGTKQQSIS